MIGDKLAKLSQRERIGLILAGVCMLMTISYAVVIRPVRNRFDRTNQDIRKASEKLARNESELDKRRQDAIRAAYTNYSHFFVKGSSADEESAEMLREIEKLSGQAGLTLLRSNPRPPVLGNVYRECVVEVDVEGPMSSCVSFLCGIQQSPQLLRVQKLALAPQSKDKTSVVKGTLAISRVTVL